MVRYVVIVQDRAWGPQ